MPFQFLKMFIGAVFGCLLFDSALYFWSWMRSFPHDWVSAYAQWNPASTELLFGILGPLTLLIYISFHQLADMLVFSHVKRLFMRRYPAKLAEHETTGRQGTLLTWILFLVGALIIFNHAFLLQGLWLQWFAGLLFLGCINYLFSLMMGLAMRSSLAPPPAQA